MKQRTPPHRFGRQARINENPREIGEPSERVSARAAKLAAKVTFDGMAPSPPLRSDGGEGWGEGVARDATASNHPWCVFRSASMPHPQSAVADFDPLTPALSPEQSRRRGSEDAPRLETAPGRGSENSAAGRGSKSYAELHCLSNFSFQRGASSAQE
jgi:hypothetical protein